MSALTDAVEARIRTQLLVELTNQNDASASATDATTLAAAATDAQSIFETHAGESFDGTNADHLRICINGVVAVLMGWLQRENHHWRMKDFEKACDDYARTRARRRVAPLTDRSLGPSEDLESDGTARRPEFDRGRFDRLDVVAPPDGSED